jgi:hypothetical protein
VILVFNEAILGHGKFYIRDFMRSKASVLTTLIIGLQVQG